jgi:hypothetical protein
MREVAVRDAVQNSLIQARFNRSNQDALLRDMAADVASTSGGGGFRIYRYSLMHTGSNVSKEDINTVFGAFHIGDGWSQMDKLLAQIGSRGLILEQRFTSTLSKRHEAAHTSTANITIADLEQLALFAVDFAASFDILASFGCNRILQGNPTPDKMPKIKDVTPHTICLVDELQDGTWSRINKAGRPIKKFGSATDAVLHPSNLGPGDLSCVARSRQLRISAWRSAGFR